MFLLFSCYQLKKLIYHYRKPKLVMIGLLHVYKRHILLYSHSGVAIRYYFSGISVWIFLKYTMKGLSTHRTIHRISPAKKSASQSTFISRQFSSVGSGYEGNIFWQDHQRT